jgi:hypothetical protein
MYLAGLKFTLKLTHLTIFLSFTINIVHLVRQNGLQDPGVYDIRLDFILLFQFLKFFY